MALLTYGGTLLRVAGHLTNDLDCCCEVDDCPTCCIEILDGEFNDDGNLEIYYTDGTVPDYSLLVTITMPTAFSRYVCEDDYITVTWELQGDDPPTDVDGYINFGPSWLWISSTPTGYLSQLGPENQGGVVEWVEEDSTLYETVLQYSPCFADHNSTNADIIVGTKNPALATTIEARFCGSITCCDVANECSPCCVLFSTTGGSDFKTGVVYWAEQDGYRMIVYISKRKVCLEEQVEITVKYIQPDTTDVTTFIPKLRINHPGWTRDAFTPPVDGGDGDDSNDDFIYWGSVAADDYTLTLSFQCQWDEEGNPIYPDTIDFLTQEPTLSGLTVSAVVTECDMTDCCPPPPCDCECVTYDGTTDPLLGASGTFTNRGRTVTFTPADFIKSGAECYLSGHVIYEPAATDDPPFFTPGFDITFEIYCDGTDTVIDWQIIITDNTNTVLEIIPITKRLEAGEGCNLCVNESGLVACLEE